MHYEGTLSPLATLTYRAVLFDDKGVSHFTFKCAPENVVSIETEAALREEFLSREPRLSYFKLTKFACDPESSILHRLLAAFHAISKHLIEEDDFACNLNTGKRDRGSANNNLRALLIDFDWAAEDGVGRYPVTLSMSEEFALTIAPYGLMLKGHDFSSLEFLRR
ncbi:hypothetical protein MSAN_00925300 [Mycena sanguinolenta]|uniref:Uncharacterized protein n=1 Tax=Mycena sanguinolenta TaxID=230812 RepID=A0A8H6YWU4_9AGAR|nr:hypothetical protein MSAN_00925300 [Mycena sanguinolenta]